MSDSNELARLIGAMSDLPWSAAVHGSMGAHDYVLSGPDMRVPYCEKNDALAIAALANHAPALLELVRACEAMERSNNRFHSADLHAIRSALAAVHAVGKEWSCPVDSNECQIRRECTNKCGRKDPP